MPYMPILVMVASGILFYRAATYERMSGPIWATASVGLSVVMTQFGGIGLMILAQIGLFVAMWIYNAQRSSRPRR